MNKNVTLPFAGFIATAIAFGPARIGYGLFLPQFRAVFDLSLSAAGFIASAAFAGFFIALLLTSFLTISLGPRIPVIIGGLAAAIGMGLVATAQHVVILAIGVTLSASSAGFSWVPYNKAAEKGVSKGLWERALSVISTGTTFGIAGTAFLALGIVFIGFNWRVTWIVFAAGGMAAALANLVVLRNLSQNKFSENTIKKEIRDSFNTNIFKTLIQHKAYPLYAIALSFGITNAVYLSFAVDHITSLGGITGFPAATAGPVVYLSFGLAGVLGLFTGEIERQIGLNKLLRTIFICSFLSLILIGIIPTEGSGVILSASLQGICVMTISSIMSFWSLRIFPSLPSISFTAVLLLFAAGNVIGPFVASIIAERIGMQHMFYIAAALSILTALLLPRRLQIE